MPTLTASALGENMKEKREKRLNSVFQKEIYNALKYKAKNPNITEIFSISEVDLSSDLKHAKVYVSIFSTDENKRKATFSAICDSAKAVRSELGRVMRIRTVPELHFALDDSALYGEKIDELLGKLTYSEDEK